MTAKKPKRMTTTTSKRKKGSKTTMGTGGQSQTFPSVKRETYQSSPKGARRKRGMKVDSFTPIGAKRARTETEEEADKQEGDKGKERFA